MKIKPTRKNCIDYLYLIAMHFNYEFVRHPDFERFKMYAEVVEESIELLKEQEAVEPRVSSVEQRCGNCNKVIEMDGWIACPWCGKPIDWEGWWKKNGTRNQDT